MYSDSVAMTQTVHEALAGHLLRQDQQEDICLATYAVSTGATRVTRLLHEVQLPAAGDRSVRGTATIQGSYVLRVAALAAQRGHGIAILHSHPDGRGWQRLSRPDAEAEKSYATLAKQITGQPLVGLTLAGDTTWSGRVWENGRPHWVGSVRQVGRILSVSWNDALIPAPEAQESQLRTISAWGAERQRTIARLRILVVGAGSVGLDVIQRLAATGIQVIGIMDLDRVQTVNRDRMIGATRRDARHHNRKVDVGARLARLAATADTFKANRHHVSVCSPEGRAAALDYDVIFSCVDRPWPRAVLNSIAYADLVPVIDGGIAIDTFENGAMRGATRRTQIATPGVACLACSKQINMSDVALEMSGDLDDPEYIKRAGREPVSGRPNVAALSAGVSASQLELFVSLLAHPGGVGSPGPLRFMLAIHHLQQAEATTGPYCAAEQSTALGDMRTDLCREIRPINSPSESMLARVQRLLQCGVDVLIERVSNADG